MMDDQTCICSYDGRPEIRDIVVCSNEASKIAHKGLYAFEESRYIKNEHDILSTIIENSSPDIDRMHIAADWQDVIRLALWTKDTPGIFDVIRLLKNAGISNSEAEPFSKADPMDLLPWLYYGKRFDVLRRICNAAKKTTASCLNRREQHIYIHLIYEDTGQIIASSL